VPFLAASEVEEVEEEEEEEEAEETAAGLAGASAEPEDEGEEGRDRALAGLGYVCACDGQTWNRRNGGCSYKTKCTCKPGARKTAVNPCQ
jgi:hypothetical protein